MYGVFLYDQSKTPAVRPTPLRQMDMGSLTCTQCCTHKGGWGTKKSAQELTRRDRKTVPHPALYLPRDWTQGLRIWIPMFYHWAKSRPVNRDMLQSCRTLIQFNVHIQFSRRLWKTDVRFCRRCVFAISLIDVCRVVVFNRDDWLVFQNQGGSSHWFLKMYLFNTWLIIPLLAMWVTLPGQRKVTE